MKKVHGNSLRNDKPHHLYEIRDKEKGEVFKYGISSGPIDEEGQSLRMRIQVEILNLGANWLRYFARILIRGIAGRKKAKEIENQHIQAFQDKNGRKPRGNR
jgi:hypothetical protein